MTVKYVIGHWTGVNTYNVTPALVKSYQLLIKRDGETVLGAPQGQTASTGGMNSITYNISCCGGDKLAPLTKIQCEKFFKECAKVLKQYNLPVNRFYTHHEIGEMCRDKSIVRLLPYNKWLYQNIGKIDLITLPYDFKDKSHGDFIRNKIQWYYDRL
jgi:hypothetical protein